MRWNSFPQGPAFTLKAVFMLKSRSTVELQNRLRLTGYPKFTGHLRSSKDQGSSGQMEATSARHVALLAAVTTHARTTLLLPQEPGHQQITTQMSAQRLERLAFSGSRLENALGREPRRQQYPAPLTLSYLKHLLQ